MWVAAPTVAAIPEAPASASAARHESTEDETREKERLREGQEKRDTEKEKRRRGQEERETEKGRRRDHRTSKIGWRRKRRAEKREGRKEGRTRASRRSGRRTHRSQAGQARNLSLSPSFSFDPRPRFLRAPRASQPLFLFLFRPRAQPSPHHSPRAATRTPLCTLLTTENRGPPPSPSPSSTLPGPSAPCRLKPPFSPLLRARPRQTKTNYAAFSEPQRAPTSYTSSFPFPLMPPPFSILVYLLPRNSPPTSPNHPHATFLVPAETTPDQLLRPPRLRYVGHQMGAQPLRTPGKRLVQERQADSCNPPANFPRALSFLLCLLLLPPLTASLPSNVHASYG